MASKQKTQAAQVMEALELLGGMAQLGDLYRVLLQSSARDWETKTPQATIRRIVRNTKGIIVVKDGLYALEAHKKRLNIAEITKEDSTEAQEFTHYYYQGLAAEIGNMKNHKVFTPAQDRQKAFMQKTLADVTTCPDMPPFGYSQFTKKAKSIDVVWFNERAMPCHLIEIEHTTDFTGALGRFLALRDFNTEMSIVSAIARKRQYDERIQEDYLQPIKKRVKFMDYDHLTKQHFGMVRLALLENTL